MQAVRRAELSHHRRVLLWKGAWALCWLRRLGFRGFGCIFNIFCICCGSLANIVLVAVSFMGSAWSCPHEPQHGLYRLGLQLHDLLHTQLTYASELRLVL